MICLDFAKCSRCGNEGETMPMCAVRPGGHSMFGSAPPIPPTVEHVCGVCITDFEIMIMLTPVVEYVLSGMIKDVAKKPESDWRNEQVVRLESVRVYFKVLNHQKDNRPAALKALGFGVAPPERKGTQ